MRIKSMTAVFGGLDRAVLEPGPGLNLIYAPNEGGKSTWAAFWRAMLYGIDTREREKKGYLTDKKRYQPWSGLPMEGEITLEWQGRDITIRRGPRGNTPFGSFSAVYAGTQEPVPGLTASECGQLLTGVGQETFTRSAFLGAGNLALTAAPELERRIAALVTAGEENVSFSQTMGRLKEWKNRRQVNKSVGEIPKLEGELRRVEEAIGRLEEISGQITELEEGRAALEAERDGLQQQAEVHRTIARKKLAGQYVQAEEEYRAAQEQYETLKREQSRFGPLPDREQVKGAQGELQYLKVLDEEIKQGDAALEEAERRAAQAQAAARDDLFSELSGEEAVAKAEADCAACQAASDKAKKLKRWFLPLQLLGLLAFTALAFLGMTRLGPLCLGAGGGVYMLLAFVSILALSRSKAAKNHGAEILNRYGVQTPEELTALAQDYRERCREAEESVRLLETVRRAVADRKERREATKTQLLDFVHTFAPEVRDLFGCSAALSRALSLEHDLALSRERAEGRRQRLDGLAARGARPEEDFSQLPPAPELGPEEIARALVRNADQLERETARLNQARGSRRTMGDPAALAARREELENALARKRLELEALTLAMDTVTQANTLLQERFSPALNDQAGRYFARLTGDKYRAVSLTRELEGFVREENGVLPRSALALSRGTADQLYLAVRLALCRLCLPEKPPIFLDDALTAFDDLRLGGALDLLQELAEEQQILLFTCQKREGEALAGVPGVTRLTL